MLKRNREAQSIMEYMTLMVFLITAIFVFQNYIIRAYAGGWKKAGDVFGSGRQYDPRPYGTDGDAGGTLECFFDAAHCTAATGPTRPCTLINKWISKECYSDHGCDCTVPVGTPEYITDCLSCLEGCSEDTAEGDLCADVIL